MPIVRIDIQEGKTTAYKRAILRGVRDALTRTFDLHDDRVMQRIIETPGEDIDATEVKSDRLTVVEISILPRTAELKSELFRAIAMNLGLDPGISAHDLVVLVNQAPPECLYLNGAVPGAAAPSQDPASGKDES